MGRPKGSKNKASIHRERRVSMTGETPLDALIISMRRHLRRAQEADDEEKYDKGDALFQLVVDAAAKAAPFVHPRLATIDHTHTQKRDLSRLSDSELDTLIRILSKTEPPGVIDLVPAGGRAPAPGGGDGGSGKTQH